jgi:hypothetical protein
MKANQVILQCQHLLRKKFRGTPAPAVAVAAEENRRRRNSNAFHFQCSLQAL